MAEPSDVTLIRQCLDGNRNAFGILVERYQTVVYNAAFQILNNSQDAEDVTQTVFMKVYEKLGRFNSNYKFFSWIYRATINEAINLSKRKNRAEYLDSNISTWKQTPVERMTPTEAEERIRQAILMLKTEDRAIVVLKHFEGFSYDEIAYILEISAKKVKSRLFAARKRLKDILLRQHPKYNG